MADSIRDPGALQFPQRRARRRRLLLYGACTAGMAKVCSILLHGAIEWAGEPSVSLSVGHRLGIVALMTMLGIAIATVRVLWPAFYGWSGLAVAMALAYEATGQFGPDRTASLVEAVGAVFFAADAWEHLAPIWIKDEDAAD